MTKITVGLITYNRPVALRKALNSILNQSYKNFKILIGNDYPKTRINFKSLGIKKNNKIEIFNHKKNLGERNNMNFLLNKSNSEWFIWLADDDYFHKDLFKRLLDAGKKNPTKTVGIFSNYSRVDLKNKIKNSKAKKFNRKDFLKGFTEKKIRMIGVFGLLKTKFLKKINGIHKTGKSFLINGKISHHYPYCDILVPILLSNYGKIIWLDEKLVHLNTDTTSISSYTTDYNTYANSEVYIFNHLKKSLKNINFKDRKIILLNMIEWFFFNRLDIIKKRTIFTNILYFPLYLFDLLKINFFYMRLSIFSNILKIYYIFKFVIKSINRNI